MPRFLLAASFLLLVGGSVRAQTTTIDFEFYPGLDGLLGTADDIPIVAPTQYAQQPVQLTDQFSALGIDFTPDPPIDDQNEILNASTFTIPAGHTAPNLLGSLFFAPISGSFSHPVHTLSALVGFTGAVEMEIYDAAGASLGTTIGNSVVISLTSATPIASFEFRASGFAFGVAVDNLAFDAAPTGPSLAAVGQCGQPGSGVQATHMTPGGPCGFAASPSTVGIAVPVGPCGPVALGIGQPLYVVGVYTADANGTVTVLPPNGVPAQACGWSVQAIDVASCVPTNVAVL